MHVTVTGATGTVGTRLVGRLLARGDRVTVLSRDADRARAALGGAVEAFAWDPASGPPPAAALEGRDAVVNLAGEPVFQRWTAAAKPRIEASRWTTTRHLVDGLAAAADGPRTLVSGSASGIYGDRGDVVVREDAPAADDFLGRLARVWEQEARRAEEHGVRVALVRTGMVLDADGGALPVIARPVRLFAGAWLGSGRQWVPWIHVDDHVGILLAALDADGFSGPVNASAPEPATNKALTKAIGRTLRRPVLAGAPAPLLRAILGEQAALVLDSCRMVPDRAGELGYAFAHPTLDGALRDLLGR
ncbi:TIGR01777 family oxidoreductase [Patulibacter sp. SYSU D01012]|uniref:TIGR01777 family oxidoreductase n=1 Tax=Patulibacter sp. SYSU D01012 TaxID=2817381 RepID=UPI001B302FF2|nr:TIGR01777 family oxidoreductase [Patulibacter sp. SYSU D01012]